MLNHSIASTRSLDAVKGEGSRPVGDAQRMAGRTSNTPGLPFEERADEACGVWEWILVGNNQSQALAEVKPWLEHGYILRNAPG